MYAHSVTWEVFTHSPNPIDQAHPWPSVSQASSAQRDLSTDVREPLEVLTRWPPSLGESEKRGLGQERQARPERLALFGEALLCPSREISQ